MIGNTELEALGDKLQTTLVELVRCREREAKYRQESQTLLCGVATLADAQTLEQVLDTIRAAETVPESGPMTRASNAATEAKAQAIEAGAPLVDEQAAADPVPEPVDDPVRDQILALPDGARQDALLAWLGEA